MQFPFADLRANGPIDYQPLSPDHPHPAPVHITDTESDGDNHCELDLRCVGAYRHEPVEWLWPEKIPIGKVTLLVGDPGLGKSLLALDVAARVTTGAAFPDSCAPNFTNPQSEIRNPKSKASHSPLPSPDSPNPQSEIRNPQSKTPGSVLLLTNDDDVADTIRPRLDALGANVGRVFFLPAVADLRHDFGQLEAALNRLPDCRLIVVDPVNAYVGPSDSHFHTIVRKVLAPLAALAAKHRVAILAVTHLRKRDGSAIQNATGSMGFVAAARSVWTVCRDREDPRRTLLLPVKNNLGRLGAGLAYSIDSDTEFDAPVLRWLDTAVTTTVAEAFQPPAKPRGPDPEERRQAGEWLKLALAGGPRESWLVLREGKQNGFSPRTLRRALFEIGGASNKQGFVEGWWWSLAQPQVPLPPTAEPKAPAGNVPPAEQPGLFAETWPLRENTEDSTAALRPKPGPPPDPRPDSPHELPSEVVQLIQPTLAESIRFLIRRDTERQPQSNKPRPPSPSNDK